MARTFEFVNDLTCSLGVSDMEASIQWYEENLGLELLYKKDDIRWCEMKTSIPGVSIGFSEVESVEVVGGPTLVFGVDDIEAAYNELKGREVRFDGEIMTIPGLVKLATFFDRDGHKYMFSQSLSSDCAEPQQAGSA